MDNKTFYKKLWNESKMGRIGCGTPTAVIIATAIALLLFSCATRTQIEYVDREVVKHQKEIVHDTLLQHTHDSIYHTVFQKGDTVYDTKYIEKTKWRDKVVCKIDTFYRDSVYVQTKEKTVEKKVIPKWCYLCLAVCVVFFIFAARKVIQFIQTK